MAELSPGLRPFHALLMQLAWRHDRQGGLAAGEFKAALARLAELHEAEKSEAVSAAVRPAFAEIDRLSAALREQGNGSLVGATGNTDFSGPLAGTPFREPPPSMPHFDTRMPPADEFGEASDVVPEDRASAHSSDTGAGVWEYLFPEESCCTADVSSVCVEGVDRESATASSSPGEWWSCNRCRCCHRLCGPCSGGRTVAQDAKAVHGAPAGPEPKSFDSRETDVSSISRSADASSPRSVASESVPSERPSERPSEGPSTASACLACQPVESDEEAWLPPFPRPQELGLARLPLAEPGPPPGLPRLSL